MDNGIDTDSYKKLPSSENGSPQTFWRTIREWIQVIVIALVISLPVRIFIATPFVVNGASMDPTFSTGQFLIVDRLSYRLSQPNRGDVIVFEYPNNPSIYYIKRVIGLPGEKVSIKDGQVTITRAATSTATSTESSRANLKPFTLKEPYVEPIHASHDSLSVTLSDTDYFVMGDNRNQSSDSRMWGPLPAHFIIGRPIVRLLPVNTFSFVPGESRY